MSSNNITSCSATRTTSFFFPSLEGKSVLTGTEPVVIMTILVVVISGLLLRRCWVSCLSGDRGGPAAATFRRLDQLDRFGPVDRSLGAYSNASAVRVYAGGQTPPLPPFRKGIVFIGGFGDPPSYWDRLLPIIEKRTEENNNEKGNKNQRQRPLFLLAPRTPGWGRTDFDEAKRISRKEWVLAAREALTIASSLCSHVTVVAHSTGAPVVAAASLHAPVDRIVCTGPNFLPATKDRSVKRLVVHPILGKIITFFKPIITKRLRGGGRPTDSVRTENHKTGFYLLHFPSNAVREMWLLQDEILNEEAAAAWGVKEGVVLVMGEEDGSVGPIHEQAETVRRFVTEGKGGSLETRILQNAAHNLCAEDETVLEELANIVLNRKNT